MSGRRDDGGFTLIETLLSIGMITVTMTALLSFWLRTTTASAHQAQIQAADQVASTTLERVSQLPGIAVVSGRPLCLMQEQWAPTSPSTPAVPDGVSTFLAQMTPVGDTGLASFACASGSALSTQLDAAAAQEAVPTRADVAVTVGASAVHFTSSVFIGACWQDRSTPGNPNPDASCAAPTQATIPATKLAMLRVVVAVTWTSNRCPASTHICTYLADTIVNQALTDLTFQ